MDFNQISIFGSYISKEYSRDIFKLLLKYSDISASEAASRLNLHIKTVQDFLEAMESVGILKKQQISDRKRPYNRYSLENKNIKIDYKLSELLSNEDSKSTHANKIRETNNSGARFTTARYNSSFSGVLISQGSGRLRTERRVSLTDKQGRFLYNLPFPGAQAKTIVKLLQDSNLNSSDLPEINDILELLLEQNIIEIVK